MTYLDGLAQATAEAPRRSLSPPEFAGTREVRSTAAAARGCIPGRRSAVDAPKQVVPERVAEIDAACEV